ncbi:uncharacterized protein LDX57_001504 [Aspergillus melleus]|uniref:uncharacterized protein n=1 Tax=Aspergillus melleus TaxID=138277 RepID=UPI001E8D61A4|nr:uncharacterized protein LDX57_001504 [Aspergillus melleus]KAH8423748.1 hypothetical protein LDX57_001504 [Aspergillus melleus]
MSRQHTVLLFFGLVLEPDGFHVPPHLLPNLTPDPIGSYCNIYFENGVIRTMNPYFGGQMLHPSNLLV